MEKKTDQNKEYETQNGINRSTANTVKDKKWRTVLSTLNFQRITDNSLKEKLMRIEKNWSLYVPSFFPLSLTVLLERKRRYLFSTISLSN